MSKSGQRAQVFSALEVANICGVVNQTAINWIRNGHMKAFTTPGGQYRVYAKDLAAFLDKRGMNTSGQVLRVMAEDNANWDVFLIAADTARNDFVVSGIEKRLPEYKIIQAFDWFDIGRKMTEKKPGIILLDAGLKGAEITKFIDTVKKDIFFGNPFVLLLTDDGSDLKADAVFTMPPDFEKLETSVRNLQKQRAAVQFSP